MEDGDARQRLADEKARLQGVRDSFDDAHLSDETEQESVAVLSSVSQHQADLGSETFEREKDLSILESIEAELGDVEHALQRLDEGTYGTCEACGRPIDEQRLAALPATRLCRDDQERAERQVRAPGAGGE